MALNRIERRKRIHYRIRKHVSGTAEKPRMVVFRSNKQIYVQVVNDEKGVTLVAAASNDTALAAACKGKNGVEAAAIVGKAIAERALAKGITAVAFYSVNALAICADDNTNMVCAAITFPIKENDIAGS